MLKIDCDESVLVLQDISLDDLKEELPERQPRYPHHHLCITVDKHNANYLLKKLQNP